MAQQTICLHCGEKENFHFNYDYTQKHMPVINVLCNECGGFFNINKEEQKQLLIEIMEADANDGLYKQQTAVEWLHQIFKQREPDKFDWEQAKEMEKEQVSKAHYDGYYSEDLYDTRQYYNDTYGK